MKNIKKIITISCIAFISNVSAQKNDSIEKYNLHFQFTTIDQWHGNFKSPYSGIASLKNTPEECTSITSTLFLGIKLWKNASLYFNPEMSGGQGFSGSTGIAGFPNGEIYRVAEAGPQIYLGRLEWIQYVALAGSKPIYEESDQNQLAENIPDKYFKFVIGKFCLADFFDGNTYSHDARTQFLNWALMDNGAWDYPANTRGYTGSFYAEYKNGNNSLKAAASLEPTYANGSTLDWNINKTLGFTFEADRDFKFHEKKGRLGLLLYDNITRAGNYDDALALKNSGVDTTLNVSSLKEYNGNQKYGFGISFNQELTKKIGIFARVGWNDGHTATWAFTEIDQTAAVGISCKNIFFKKIENTLGVAVLVDGISSEHSAFLNAGGIDFIIGDGKLPHYATENILEAYYNIAVTKNIFITADYQYVQNPAYNSDRGPVTAIVSGRIHVSF